ncbi:MAG: hypothetical protein K1X75_14130 [Leptospirales bacterium]|nr:hypothetical protein [Leptospirales bacterium]
MKISTTRRLLASLLLLSTAAACTKPGVVEQVAPAPAGMRQFTADDDDRIFALVGENVDSLLMRWDGERWNNWPGSETRAATLRGAEDQRLWLLQRTEDRSGWRLRAVDSDDGMEEFKIDIPPTILSPEAIPADVAVSSDCLIVADSGRRRGSSAIVAYDPGRQSWRRFDQHDSLEAEADEGESVEAGCGVASVGMDDEEEYVYYGARCGRSWYSLRLGALCPGLEREELVEAISLVGPKPSGSSGSVDRSGRTRFADGDAIAVLDADGLSQRLAPAGKALHIQQVAALQGRWLLASASQRNAEGLTLVRIQTGIRARVGH